MTSQRRADDKRSPSAFGADLLPHQIGRQHWFLREEQVSEFLNERGLRLDQWVADGRARVVKSGAHRVVYRLDLSSGVHYLKHYKLADARAWVQNNIRRCRAFREAAAITSLTVAGIATAELVAVGREVRAGFSGASYVITRELAKTTPLDEWVQRSDSIAAARRHHVIEQLARLTALLHQYGMFHADFHGGNVLVQQDGSAIRLFLIDLLPLRRRRMHTKRRWSMLGMLATSFCTHASIADRRRFLQHYSLALGSNDEPRAVERFCAIEINRRLTRADRKWRRGNRHVAILDGGGVACRGLAAIGVETLTRWRNAIARGEGALLPKSATLRRLPSEPAARSAWEMGHALARRGLPVARPLLALEKRGMGFVVREGVQPCAALPDWLKHSSDAGCQQVDRAQILTSLGRWLRRLDEAGYCVPPEAIAISTKGRVIIDRPELVTRKRRFWSRKDRSLAYLLAVLKNADDQVLVRNAYRGTSHQRQNPPGAVLHRHLAPDITRRAAAVLLLAIVTAIAGCRSLDKGPPVAALPAKHSVRAGQLLLISDFKLAKDDPLVDDLIDLREQVVSTLQLPEPRQDVVVYMFSNEDAYRRYLDTVHPGLPSRRAYFVGTKKELAVYTFWGDRIQEDLRHEYTHGILHASLTTVPLWLDEGLAEYFEVPGPSPGGMNGDYPHQLAVAVANGWRPDIDRLEQVEEFSQLKRIDYQESWAWVHYLLHASPNTRQELLAYINDLRDSTRPPMLAQRISTVEPGYPARFLGYVASLNSSGGAVIRAASEL